MTAEEFIQKRTKEKGGFDSGTIPELMEAYAKQSHESELKECWINARLKTTS